MSNDNWFGVEPPKDASGKVIPLDTETLYSTNGQVFHVDQFRYFTKVNRWAAYGAYEHMSKLWADNTFCFLLTPPDSWEKLSEDAMKTTCNYALAPRDEDGFTTCEGCRFQKRKDCYQEMTLDVLARAKRLAGVEEQEASDD